MLASARKSVYNIENLQRGLALGFAAATNTHGGGRDLYAYPPPRAQYQPARAGRWQRSAPVPSPRVPVMLRWMPLSPARADWVRSAQARVPPPGANEEAAEQPRTAAPGPRRWPICRRCAGHTIRSSRPPARAAHMPKIAVRDMTTRWGSCSLRTGTLAFARRLCAMPLPAQEYVVVHEFCHFAHPDHSPAFWAAVAEVLPDYKAAGTDAEAAVRAGACCDCP